VVDHLGADLAQDVEARLARAPEDARRGRRRIDLDEDLYPRDGFTVP
jgi:hypothetical protein